MNNKIIVLILFFALMSISISFASDEMDENLTVENDDELGDLSTVYYFDATAASDGTGSKTNPYKYLTSSRLWGGATCYFAEGEYELDSAPWMLLGSVELKGNNPQTTTIKYDGEMFSITSSTSVLIEGLTISGANFNLQGGTLNAKNTIFTNANGISSDEYGNIFGSVVTSKSTYYTSSQFTADNCTFKNNNAEYGGVGYISKGSVEVTNSIFENNYATQFGAVFAGEDNSNIVIKNSLFKNCYSVYDSGVVYILNSKATITDSNFTNCRSFLGPVLTALNSTSTVSNIQAIDNNASWQGGAIYAMYGSLTITDSLFNGTTARDGGAVFGDNLTSLKISNCEFSFNEADDTGGAILSFGNVNVEINNNRYNSNKANRDNDVYDSKYLDLAIGSDDYEMMQYKQSQFTNLPSRYDARDYGYVSSLKEQADSGNCWAYATIAALESCIMKATGIEYDLSEGNLKNHAQYFSDYGWQYKTNNGGFYDMAVGYITNWLGPVLDSDDLTDDYDVLSPVINSLMHVQNILYLQRSSYTDNNAIKQAILNYGAVATEMNIVFSSQYMNRYSYYYNGDDVRNHAVIIIGWDDTYSRNNFAITPPGDGAFLIKNSYGTRWGDNGYGYVSYYDTRFAQLNAPYNTFTFILNDTVRFNKNYQYDFAGKTDYFVTGKSTIWYENVFNSTGNDLLAAFSTYFNTTTDWQAYVYVNDDLMLSQTGSAESGYYTFNFDNLIPLNVGDTFRIALKISAEGYASFPISEHLSQYSTSRQFYRPGVSYFSYDGKNWIDLCDYYVNESYGHKYSSQVACIKAFTTSSGKLLNTAIEIVNWTGDVINAKVVDENNNPVLNGNVLFKINNGNYTVPVKNGIARLDLNLTHDSYTVLATYIANNNYNSSHTSKTIEITNDELYLKISSADINYTQDLIINIEITNYRGEKVIIPVIITIGNATYNVNSTQLRISNLKPGNYTVRASIENTIFSDEINVWVLKLTSQLSLTAGDIVYGENLNIRFVSNFNGSIKVKIANKSYDVDIMNNNMILTVKDLNVGVWDVYAEFGGDEYYFSCDNQIRVNVKKLNTSISTSCEDIYLGEIADINIILPEGITGSVIVKLNENNYFTTIKNSKANVKIPNLEIGRYTYSVEYAGNEIYNPAGANGFFNVLKINESESKIIMDAPDVEKYYSAPDRFKVSVYSENRSPIANKTITITINGGEYSRMSNGNGSVSFALNLNSGIYEVTVVCENISKIAAVNIKSTIQANNIVKIFKNSTQYVASFVDGNGFKLTNKTVSFNINGIIYNKTTNNEGIARLNINLAPGNYILTATNPSTGEKISNNITVLPNIVENSNLVKYYRNSSQYSVMILDGNGNPLANKTVSFNINGMIYQRTTNINGIARLNINLQPGDYIITAEYNGCRVSNNISILPVLFTDNLVKTYKTSKQFEARLIDGAGNPLMGKNITFNINGVFYNRTTNSEGIAKLNINLMSGSYIITSSYDGTNMANIVTIYD